MHSTMDFLGYLLVLGIIVSMLGVLGVVGFFWANKWKILLAIGTAISGYIYLRRKREEESKNGNSIDIQSKKKIQWIIT